MEIEFNRKDAIIAGGKETMKSDKEQINALHAVVRSKEEEISKLHTDLMKQKNQAIEAESKASAVAEQVGSMKRMREITE